MEFLIRSHEGVQRGVVAHSHDDKFVVEEVMVATGDRSRRYRSKSIAGDSMLK